MTRISRVLKRRDLPWITALVSINAIALLNAFLHDPLVGYDAADHLKYIEALSQLRLPTRVDTREFFSPPLPYLLPALLRATGWISLWGAAKAAQLANVAFSIALTWTLTRICEKLRPGDARLKTTALVLLGMLPVYYKSFAFVRGEPLLALLAVVVVYRAVALPAVETVRARDAILLGGSLGLAILSRQWGFFLFPAVAIFAGMLMLRSRRRWLPVLLTTSASFLVAAAIGGWFYLHLRQTSGSMRAFNRPASETFSLSNQTPEFFLGLGVEDLFSDPVRRSFHNQLIPIFYSEIWGDYWTCFTVYGRDLRGGEFVSGGALYEALSAEPPAEWLATNRHEIASYLGRANLVSLVPAALLLAGTLLGAVSSWRLLAGSAPESATAIRALLFLVVAASVAGYFWFLIMYPRADTIKATYMLQVFPATAILAAEFERILRRRWIFLDNVALALVGIVILHNAPLFVTRYH